MPPLVAGVFVASQWGNASTLLKASSNAGLYSSGVAISKVAGSQGIALRFFSLRAAVNTAAVAPYVRVIVFRGDVPGILTAFTQHDTDTGGQPFAGPASVGALLAVPVLYENVVPMGNMEAQSNLQFLSGHLTEYFGDNGPQVGPGETLTVFVCPVPAAGNDANANPEIMIMLNAFGYDLPVSSAAGKVARAMPAGFAGMR